MVVDVDITLITEDDLSVQVAGKIMSAYSPACTINRILRWNKQKIAGRISGINQSAHGMPFFVLTDQDTQDNCPASAVATLNQSIHPNLLYRFAVMEVESWLLADRSGICNFLGVPYNKVPDNPETISQPKETLIELTRKFGRYHKDAIVNKFDDTQPGPDYNGTLGRFVVEKWNVEDAARSSQSLQRTLRRVANYKPVISKKYD